MNQILITEKLYITPELRKKKKIYKFNFLLSIFLVLFLASLYIYAEYDRNKSEEVSQEILESMDNGSDDTVAKNNVLVHNNYHIIYWMRDKMQIVMNTEYKESIYELVYDEESIGSLISKIIKNCSIRKRCKSCFKARTYAEV